MLGLPFLLHSLSAFLVSVSVTVFAFFNIAACTLLCKVTYLAGVYPQISHLFFFSPHFLYITHSMIDLILLGSQTLLWCLQVWSSQIAGQIFVINLQWQWLFTNNFHSVSLRFFLNTTAAFSCVISQFLSVLAMLSNFGIANKLHQCSSVFLLRLFSKE